MVIGSRSPGVTRSALGSGSRPGAVPEPSGATFLFVLGVWFTPPNGLDSHTDESVLGFYQWGPIYFSLLLYFG